MTTSVSEGIIKLLWIMICFLPLYGVGRFFWFCRKIGKLPEDGQKRDFWAREILFALFWLFMTGLFGLTFENTRLAGSVNGFDIRTIFAQAGRRLKNHIGVNFVPFRTIRIYLRHASVKSLKVNILGNIVMFVPWGFGLPLLWRKYQSALKVTLMSLILPLCIEFLQLFIGRSVDIDDVILNFAGGMLGGLLYLVLTRLFSGIRKLAR